MPHTLTKRLSAASRDALKRHFLALGDDDRRLRFGSAVGDAGIAAYVDRIDFDRDAVFGVFDDELGLKGVGHVAVGGDMAELGVSVLPAHRGQGIGTALFERAHTFARNSLLHDLFMHCLAENAAMMHIAKKSRMRIVAASGEVDAHLELPPSDPSSITGEMMLEQVALFDYALRAQVLSARRIGEAMRGAPEERDGTD